jgi:hypothetical protein
VTRCRSLWQTRFQAFAWIRAPSLAETLSLVKRGPRRSSVIEFSVGLGTRTYDGGQDAGDLFRWSLEILSGENPKRDGGNGELAAPIEYLIELARSEAVNRMRIGEAESLPISKSS